MRRADGQIERRRHAPSRVDDSAAGLAAPPPRAAALASATTTCAAAPGDLQRDLAADAAAAADDTATVRLNSRSGGIRCSLASSSAQYSMRNASSRGSAT